MNDSSGGATPAQSIGSLVDLAVESWRFSRVFGRLLGKLEVSEASRYSNQSRYFLKKVDEALGPHGLRVVNLEGMAYDTGMAVTALNIGDFAPDQFLCVEQMVEPVVMGPNGLVRSGTVILAQAEQT